MIDEYTKSLEKENIRHFKLLKELEDENERLRNKILPPLPEPVIRFDGNGRVIFKIDVGKLPRQKAEEYVEKIMKEHRNKNKSDLVPTDDFWQPIFKGDKNE